MSGNSLRLVDQDNKVWLELDKMQASCLASELGYTIDWRPEQYPEYAMVQDAIYGWLDSIAQS